MNFRPSAALSILALILSPLCAESNPGVETAVRSVYPSLVRIHVVSEDGRGGRMEKNRGSGSGAIIDEQGHILTNHHVAGRATRITVRLADRQELRATLVGTDALSDLAVLKIDPAARRDPSAPLPVARFGDSSQLKVGDTVFAMGSPAGISQSVTQGIVANTEMIAPGGAMRLDGEWVGELVRWIGHDAIIYPGNSGGPLVNTHGEIIGINEVGIGSLGGAIPSNLARKVAAELIEHGYVRRSWIGLEVQPLLKSMPSQTGILAAGVIEGSPAAQAGILPGDILTRCQGEEIATARAPEDVPLFNRMVLEAPIGSKISLEGLRDGKPVSWNLTTIEREPAQPRERELLSWGVTARDLTQLAAKELLREDADAVFVQSVRTGGPAASAKPALRAGSLILSLNGKPTPDLTSLESLTREITADSEEPVPTLVAFEVDGSQFLTVVKIGPEPEPDRPNIVRKATLALDTQVISPDLAKALGMEGTPGVRVTRVHPHGTAAQAGIQVGDLILKLDGEIITANRPEDADLFSTLLRQYRVGTAVNLLIRRGSEELTIQATLERSHERTSELASHETEWLEFTARDLAQDDRLTRKLPPELQGVLVTALARSGWAALGGLQTGDILLSLDGKPTPSIDELKSILAEIEKESRTPVTLFVRRGITTRFLELEPAS
jgi:serine protease Do